MTHPLYQHVRFEGCEPGEFPAYSFSEYPKAIPRPLPEHGKRGVDDFILVHNEDEELVALGGEVIIKPERMKEILLAQCKSAQLLGVDKRWSVDRIRDFIVQAQLTPEAERHDDAQEHQYARPAR